MGETTFADLKQGLLELLRDLGAIAEERGISGPAEAASGLEKKLEEERFNVVVAGEFKRGKTTFVNALLGSDLLPAAVVPLTSVVTVVGYADEVRAEIAFRDGRTLQAGPDELPRFVTEPGNPENRLGVDRALLYVPAEDLRDGVFLIDTPGVGSVYRHNTDAARAFLPEADAAIFLVSSDPPISDSERAFLEEVREESARMFFVLNKVDYLSEQEASEAISFTESVLRRSLGREVELFPLSARLALHGKMSNDASALAASGLPRFERAFRSFLLRGKGAAILSSIAAQGRRIVADQRNSLDVEERASAMSARDLAVATDEMERIFEDARRSQGDIRTLLERDIKTILDALEERLSARRRGDAPRLARQIEVDLGSGDVREATGRVEAAVAAAVHQVVGTWRSEEERRVAEELRAATVRFVDQTNDLVDRTIRACGDLLDLNLEIAEPIHEVPGESRFTFSPRESPGMLESLLPDLRALLPRKIAEKRLAKEVRARVPDLLDKQAGRLRWDFQQRLERGRRAIQRDLDRRLEATIESLRVGAERAATRRELTSEQARTNASRIEGLRARLDEVDQGIERVLVAADAEAGADRE
jgi:GTPase Era involved in 16S rRNA processing